MTILTDQELKTRHRAMWASGDYPAVATEVIPALGPRLIEACGVRTGQWVLDMAAGCGNAAIPAALTGATVVAGDLTPELFEAGRRLAAEQGVEVEWHRVRHRALLRRGDVRPAPPAERSPSGSPARRRTAPGWTGSTCSSPPASADVCRGR